MTEILQAEIVAYSSPKEIFVNGLSRDSGGNPAPNRYKLIDTAPKCRTACWAGRSEEHDCGKAEGACAKKGPAKCAGKACLALRWFFAPPSRTLRLQAL